MLACVNGLAIMPFTSSLGSVPLCHRIGRPLGRATSMAVSAGIRRGDLHRQVWPWHPKTVITPTIDHHIESLDHVTRDALRGLGVRLMEVMLRAVVFCRQMALRAQRLAWGP